MCKISKCFLLTDCFFLHSSHQTPCQLICTVYCLCCNYFPDLQGHFIALCAKVLPTWTFNYCPCMVAIILPLPWLHLDARNQSILSCCVWLCCSYFPGHQCHFTTLCTILYQPHSHIMWMANLLTIAWFSFKEHMKTFQLNYFCSLLSLPTFLI